MLHYVDLTDAEWRSTVNKLAIDEGIREWVRVQIDRGMDYYSARIQQLGLHGARVLDAGCGIGNWSLGLARWFREVHALEITAPRLAILAPVAARLGGRIKLTLGSIECLPYSDGVFDAVFCNGVFYLTDFRRSLREFGRVLRPEGVLYATFNTHKWWLHLLHERAASDPICIFYGGNALIAALFRYLDELHFEKLVSADSRALLSAALMALDPGLVRGKGAPSPLNDAFENYAQDARIDDDEEFESLVLNVASSELARLTGAVSGKFSLVTEILDAVASIRAREVVGIRIEYRRRAVRDVLCRIVLGRPSYQLEVQTHSLEPDDLVTELSALGFQEIATSWEGTLVPKGGRPETVAPIYSRTQGVFEVMARRPYLA